MVINGKEYISGAVLSKYMDTSDQSIMRWVNEGMPYEKAVVNGREMRVYCLEDCQAWHRTTGDMPAEEKAEYYARKARKIQSQERALFKERLDAKLKGMVYNGN